MPVDSLSRAFNSAMAFLDIAGFADLRFAKVVDYRRSTGTRCDLAPAPDCSDWLGNADSGILLASAYALVLERIAPQFRNRLKIEATTSRVETEFGSWTWFDSL